MTSGLAGSPAVVGSGTRQMASRAATDREAGMGGPPGNLPSAVWDSRYGVASSAPRRRQPPRAQLELLPSPVPDVQRTGPDGRWRGCAASLGNRSGVALTLTEKA